MSHQRSTETVRTFINTGFSFMGGDAFERARLIDDIARSQVGEPTSVRPILFEEADTASVFEPGPVISVDATDEGGGVHQSDDYLQARTWNIGNRMGLDANELPWPRTTRSLSIGDVALIRGTYYAVAAIGWVEMGEPPLVATAAWGEWDATIRRDGATDWRERI